MLSQSSIELRDIESLRFPMNVACCSNSYYLKTVAFAEAQFSVGLGLECIQRHLQNNNDLSKQNEQQHYSTLQMIAKVKFHHDVEDVLRHAVGVRVVDLLLRVIRGKPANLGVVWILRN